MQTRTAILPQIFERLGDKTTDRNVQGIEFSRDHSRRVWGEYKNTALIHYVKLLIRQQDRTIAQRTENANIVKKIDEVNSLQHWKLKTTLKTELRVQEYIVNPDAHLKDSYDVVW